MRTRRSAVLLTLALWSSACSDNTIQAPFVVPGFLEGTDNSRQIGLMVNSLGRSVRLFQLGKPMETRDIALGTSSAITPVGMSVSGQYGVVPLGNAASAAVLDLANQSIWKVFTFPNGNATGSVMLGSGSVLVANSTTNVVGHFTLAQAAGPITDLVSVAPVPTAIVTTANRAFVISSNLDANFLPIGEGVVTVLNPETMAVLGTIQTGGQNPTAAAVGVDGLVYVLNTEDFFATEGSVAIINPQTLQRVALVPGFGIGPGAISIDSRGLAYVSGFFLGTLVWNTNNRTFVRGPSDPVCAKLPNGSCRGAADAHADASGQLYQAFFGSAPDNLPPWIFVFQGSSFTLRDSIATGQGPIFLDIRTF